MPRSQSAVQWLYRKLLCLYPRAFRDRLGEAMQQTFDDLYRERRRQAAQGLSGFVLWIFLETAIGIVRERLQLITEGAMMHTMKTFGSSALLGLLLMLPLMIMEVVNRRMFDEGFPFVLFFALWLNLFAIGLILLPIAQGLRERASHARAAYGSTSLTKPWLVALMAIALVFFPGIFPLLDFLGWLSIDRLFNGPNPEVAYLPGQILTVALIAFPIAGGMIAGRPIIGAMRSGGSLFAHPLHLLIVVALSLLFAGSVMSLIMDQWPCFMGVPNCD